MAHPHFHFAARMKAADGIAHRRAALTAAAATPADDALNGDAVAGSYAWEAPEGESHCCAAPLLVGSGAPLACLVAIAYGLRAAVPRAGIAGCGDAQRNLHIASPASRGAR